MADDVQLWSGWPYVRGSLGHFLDKADGQQVMEVWAAVLPAFDVFMWSFIGAMKEARDEVAAEGHTGPALVAEVVRRLAAEETVVELVVGEECIERAEELREYWTVDEDDTPAEEEA